MAIVEARFELNGFGPLLFGKQIFEQKRDDETHDAFESRIWREKAAVNDAGHVIVQAEAVHKSLVFAGSWLSLKVPGGGKKTFTKLFLCGLVCHVPELEVLKNGKPITRDDLEELPLSVPSDGKKGGSKRVIRRFPRVMPPWTVNAQLLLLAEPITEDIFIRHARAAGMFDGLGSMRIGTGGPNGMWRPDALSYTDYAM